MSFTSQEISSHLSDVIKSKPFSRSNVNVNLLKFLVNASLKNEKLKEASIGEEVFGKGYDPIKNDNKVRVYVHNLRKKLSEYYETDNSGNLQFCIEKGQYNVSFNKLEKYKNRNWKYYIGITAFVICLALFFLYQNYKSTTETTFWKPILSNKFPTKILVGDHFTIAGKIPTGGYGVFRDYQINSSAEFAEHLSQHPEFSNQFSSNHYSYITKMGAYASNSLSKFFTQKNYDYELMLNSEWDKSRINSENIIYIGQFKTLGFLQHVFFDKNSNYAYRGNIIEYTSPISNVAINYYTRSDSIIVDYTVVSTIRGPEGNQINMFISEHDIGVIHLVNYFTNNDSIKAFYKKHNLYNKDFTALFKVNGWDRTGYKMKLEQIDIK